MPIFDPKPSVIQIRSDHTTGSKFLFEFIPKTLEIRLRSRDVTYIIKINDLLTFANETDEDVFRVNPIIEDKDKM